MLLLIVVLSAILVFIIVSSLLMFIAKGGLGIDARLHRYTDIRNNVKQSASKANFEKNNISGDSKQPKGIMQLISYRIMQLIRYLGAKFKKVPKAKYFDMKMQQAGLPLLGSECLVVFAGIALIMFFIALLLTGNIIYALVSGIASILMTFIYVNIKIGRRRQAFNNQLGDALIMMANSMRSGFSFMQAVDMVANEMSSPISNEFAKLVAEMRLGIPTDEALTNLGKRVGSKDFDLVIIAVIIHRQVGGNLAQILESISTTITGRIKMKREINTLTAQGRMSGWIVGLLPFVLGLLLNFINPNYLKPLFTEPLGLILISAGLISQFIGIFFIMKIVNIDA